MYGTIDSDITPQGIVKITEAARAFGYNKSVVDEVLKRAFPEHYKTAKEIAAERYAAVTMRNLGYREGGNATLENAFKSAYLAGACA